jgi:WD40 repeat protein
MPASASSNGLVARPQKASNGPTRRIVDGWTSVASFALAKDGKIVAGENGGYRVACWDERGVLVWQVEVEESGKQSRYSYEAFVAFFGDVVLVLAKDDELVLLDAATGKRRGTVEIPKSTRSFALTPDQKTIVLRPSTETVVCEWPSMKRVARFDQYCNHDNIAISPDGRWLAVNGHEVHVFDSKKRVHVKTFEPPESPWSMCFTASGQHLVTGDDRNMLRVYDVANDFACVKEVGKNRKPTITALAASADGKWIASANELGTIVVHAAGTLDVVRELKGHDSTQPDTGAKTIAQLAFTAAGELVVSAAPKKQPAGLTIHAL